jgi:hypothetical protein
MNSNEFVHWLKGFIDACGVDLSVTQLNKIKDKLEETSEVYCPQQTTPSQPYSPPWTIGDQPIDPYRIWYTSSTGESSPSFGTDSEEYKN